MSIAGVHDRSGLDGVVAATTALSHVDGERGELIIVGEAVDDLALGGTFERTVERLRAAARPVSPPPESTLGELRVALFPRLRRSIAAASGLDLVAGMRAALAALDVADGPNADLKLTAAAGVLVPALVRAGRGLDPIAPNPSLPHAADMLRMARGKAATETEAKALDVYLSTVSDHGMNASTFACRVVIATQASLVSAVTSAYGALTGPLHGGAPGPVLDMFDEIGTERAIGPWLRDALDRGKRIMGFGHRIYRTRDPRADVLKTALERLAPDTPRLRLAAALEREAIAALAERQPGRRLDINVEYYTALLLDALGFPREAFTPVFAAGRVAGWTAHAAEHHARGGRLIRPDSRYDGAMPASRTAAAG